MPSAILSIFHEGVSENRKASLNRGVYCAIVQDCYSAGIQAGFMGKCQ